MVGGETAWNQIHETTNKEMYDLFMSFKAPVEAKVNKAFETFEPIAYTFKAQNPPMYNVEFNVGAEKNIVVNLDLPFTLDANGLRLPQINSVEDKEKADAAMYLSLGAALVLTAASL